MAKFEQKYSDEQRAAVARAYLDRGVRPARRIRELAGAGELETGLEAFDVPVDSIRDIVRKARRRRAGETSSELAKLEHVDAIEQLRRRLLAVGDTELQRLEELQRARKPVSGEEIRQVARAIRELAAIPARGSTSPSSSPKPERPLETRGGVAGSILAQHRSGGSDAQLEPESDAAQDVSGSGSPVDAEQLAPAGDDSQIGADELEPGSYVRARIGALSEQLEPAASMLTGSGSGSSSSSANR